jgi:hypothetical protein
VGVKLTDDELRKVRELTRNVTPAMRAVCAENLGDANWPEVYLLSLGDPVEAGPEVPDDAPEVSEADWWAMIHDHIPSEHHAAQ